MSPNPTLDASLRSGFQCHQAGDPVAAEAHYRRALQVDANEPRGLALLGALLLESQGPQAALPWLQRAIDCDPHNPDIHYNLGFALESTGHPDVAVPHYQAVLRARPEFTEARARLAGVLMALSRFDDAGTQMEQVVAQRPDDLDAHTHLGRIRLEQGDGDAAVALFDHVLAQSPPHTGARVGKATALHGSGRFDDALALLEPLLQDRSAHPQAAVLFASLSGRAGRTDAARDWLEALLAQQGFAPGARRTFHHSVGALYEKTGDTEAAFRHHHAANALAPGRFDPDQHRAWVDTTCAAFTPDTLAHMARSTNTDETPVFIVGMPRSGTTLVEQIIASHSQAFGAGERTEIGRMMLQIPARLGAPVDYPGWFNRVDADTLTRFSAEYMARLREAAPQARRITDKMPGNFLYLGLIARLFPNARVIHCIRDPRDTCLSCYFLGFSGAHPYTHDLDHLGRYHRQHERLMAHWKAVLDVPILELCYEDLVHNLEDQSRRLIDFVGLPWEDRCLRFYDTERTVATASATQVREPVYTRSIGRWKAYEAHLEPLLTALEREPDPNRS